MSASIGALGAGAGFKSSFIVLLIKSQAHFYRYFYCRGADVIAGRVRGKEPNITDSEKTLFRRLYYEYADL